MVADWIMTVSDEAAAAAAAINRKYTKKDFYSLLSMAAIKEVPAWPPRPLSSAHKRESLNAIFHVYTFIHQTDVGQNPILLSSNAVDAGG
jgi:hypothetical protein